jgi:hypothetical protein
MGDGEDDEVSYDEDEETFDEESDFDEEGGDEDDEAEDIDEDLSNGIPVPKQHKHKSAAEDPSQTKLNF